MRQSALTAVVVFVVDLGAALLTPIAAALEARRVTPPGSETRRPGRRPAGTRLDPAGAECRRATALPWRCSDDRAVAAGPTGRPADRALVAGDGDPGRPAGCTKLRQRDARDTPRLWVGLALGILAVAMFVVALSPDEAVRALLARPAHLALREALTAP
jgi:hypothetical protein